jgi:hypothetical protein
MNYDTDQFHSLRPNAQRQALKHSIAQCERRIAAASSRRRRAEEEEEQAIDDRNKLAIRLAQLFGQEN